MLNDIIDEYDIENNFNNLLIRYVNYLERENKWSEANTNNPKHAKSNFASRLKRLHNDGDHDKPVYKKFVAYVDKNKHRAQRDAERIAKNLMGDKEKQLQTQLAEAMKIIEAQKLEIEQLKEINIQLEQEKTELFNKYDEGYERLEEENEKLKRANEINSELHKTMEETIGELEDENKKLKESDKHLNKCIDYLRDQYLELKEEIEGDDI